MPKIKCSRSSLIRQWLQEFSCYTTDGRVVFCQPCNKEVSCEKKYHLTQHVHAISHKNNVERKEKMKQTLLTQNTLVTNKKNEFYADLCHAIIAANIPFKALENTTFREFLEKYCNKSIPSESTLRKNYLQLAYDDAIQRIAADIGDSYIWVSVDETTDALGRYMANLVIGKMDPDEPSRAYLLTTKQIDKTNRDAIAQFVNSGLKILYPRVDENKVLLLTTDAAAYMIAAAQIWKVFFPNLLHVTCLAHGLNRVAEQVRTEFPKVNKLISSVKKVFLKAPARILSFREKLPSIPLPPQPVITRWGTWLEAASYYSEHLVQIREVVNDFDDDVSSCITAAKAMLNDASVMQDLAYIRANFTFLTSHITELERSEKPLYESIQVIENVKAKLGEAQGDIGERVKAKLNSVLQTNTGFQQLTVAANILGGKYEESCAFTEHVPRFKYAPITSVDVERTFSAYKLILSDRRHGFTTENLEKVLVTYCEANYGK